MEHSNRGRFNIIWHLVAGILVAYAVAFMMLHGFSTRFDYLSYWEAVWRTISYVIPKWHFIIIPAGFIVSLLSIGIYGFMLNLREEYPNIAVHNILLIAVPSFIFVGIFQAYSLFIFLLVLIECAILVGIDVAWDKRKRKSNNDL